MLATVQGLNACLGLESDVKLHPAVSVLSLLSEEGLTGQGIKPDPGRKILQRGHTFELNESGTHYIYKMCMSIFLGDAYTT